jgi:hypothetical protein
MVELNNGNALSCIVLMLDSLAHSNNSVVEIETLHNSDCMIFDHLEQEKLTNKSLGEMKPTSGAAMEHLYSCNCNAGIEAVFSSQKGETLLVPFQLSDVKRKHPWLDDGDRTQEMIHTAREHGSDSPLMGEDFSTMKLEFRMRRGYPNIPKKDLSNKIMDFSSKGTVH